MVEAYGHRSAIVNLGLHGIAATLMTMDEASEIKMREIPLEEFYGMGDTEEEAARAAIKARAASLTPKFTARGEHKHSREIERRLKQEARNAAKRAAREGVGG